MQGNVDEGHPKVFLCFAAADHGHAERLRRDLGNHGVATASYEYQIGAGANILLEAERALSQSDYFVLLWSAAADGLPWIGEQWAAGLVRDMREKRRFFFTLRLDGTRLPHFLATRSQLDASDGWHAAVDELIATWRRERAAGHPVLPAPCPPGQGGSGPGIVLYVRNRALRVSTKLEYVPWSATGQELQDRIHAELRLPREVTRFEGAVGMRFSYRFLYRGEPLADKPLPALGLADGAFVDLEVEVEPFGPDDHSTSWDFLGDEEEPKLPPTLLRSLADAAFEHLKPW